MSVIKVTATMIFPDTVEGRAKAEAWLVKARADESAARNINEDRAGRREQSQAEMHRCFHDEKEPRPCEPLDTFAKALSAAKER